MATLIEIIILAIIQGITEWLPVSSSGHLVLAQEFFQMQQPLIFDVMLHFGTLIVVIVVFRKDIVSILKALVKRDFDSEDGKIATYIILGTIPTAIIGYVFHDYVESLFHNPLAVGIAMLFTGSMLFLSERRESGQSLGLIDSLFMAFAQVVSIIPGVSRSGSTISTGLLRGVDKQKVFKFSFLLAAPSILGATVYEAKDAVIQGVDLLPMLFGAFISMVVGYLALKALQKVLMRQQLHYFAYYCWALGSIVILALLLR